MRHQLTRLELRDLAGQGSIPRISALVADLEPYRRPAYAGSPQSVAKPSPRELKELGVISLWQKQIMRDTIT